MIITSKVQVGYETKPWTMAGDDGRTNSGISSTIYLTNSDPKGAPHRVKIKPPLEGDLTAFSKISAGDSVSFEATIVKTDLIALHLYESGI